MIMGLQLDKGTVPDPLDWPGQWITRNAIPNALKLRRIKQIKFISLAAETKCFAKADAREGKDHDHQVRCVFESNSYITP